MLVSALATLVAVFGSVPALFAIAGGPVGLAVAWIGSQLASSTVKWTLIGIGLLVLVVTSVGLTVYLEHLKQDAAAYAVLKADFQSLELKYGCGNRPEHERALPACLVARERDEAQARADEAERVSKARATEQAVLERKRRALDEREQAMDQKINDAPAADDGAVPKVLLDAWTRERAERGVK